jgi:hypothetical protein
MDGAGDRGRQRAWAHGRTEQDVHRRDGKLSVRQVDLRWILLREAPLLHVADDAHHLAAGLRDAVRAAPSDRDPLAERVLAREEPANGGR